MSQNKRKIFMIFMIISILICIYLACKLKSYSELYQKLITENEKLLEQNEIIKSSENHFNPLDHIMPNDDSDLIVKNEKEALLALLYHQSLKNYSDENGTTEIDISEYDVLYSQGLVCFANLEKDIEFVIQESDSHNYYEVRVKSIKALKNGGSGTVARYYIYKDGYVVSAY